MPQEIMCDDGSFTLVSDEHVDAIQYFNLRNVSKRGNARPNAKSYVRFSNNTGKGKTIWLHRFIMERILGRKLAPSELVDHVNGNPLDNTNDNLRIASKMQNSHNMRARHKTALISSKHKGVRWVASKNKWYARIKVNKKEKSLGYFDNENDAARAYNAAALKYFGEFARLNDV